MKREQEIKKIKWALLKSRNKKKKKYTKLRALYKKVLDLSASIWLKSFSSGNENGNEEIKDTKQGSNRSAIELNEILCLDNSTKNYADNNGFIYGKASSINGTLYLRCKNYVAKGCKCRAIVKNNNFKMAIVTNHNHSPDPKAIDRIKFAKTLEKVCLENPFMKPLLCYTTAKTILQNQIKNKNIPMANYYYVFIYRKQGRHVPVKPSSIAEFEKLIGIAKNSRLYANDSTGKIFYRGVWRGETGANIAFVSESVLKKVKKLKKVTLLMDGTFKAIPRHLKLRQLYIINVIIRGRCYPLAYILMEKKDQKSYIVVLNKLKEMIPSMNVVNCMTDYEKASRNAIEKIFPTSRLSGCLFHYVQAIRKASKRFGLRNKADGEKFKEAINKISALALLPNEYIAKGFKLISNSIENSARWDTFTEYWLRQWKKANISVYGLRHRTNNFSETLNRTINLLIGSKYPNIWFLIDNLKTLESLKSDELEQVCEGLMIIKRMKRETKRMNKKIKHASKKFNKSKNVKRFLEYVTFNEDLADIYVHDFEEANNIDDFEEEVVPNSHNSKCNYRRATKQRK